MKSNEPISHDNEDITIPDAVLPGGEGVEIADDQFEAMELDLSSDPLLMSIAASLDTDKPPLVYKFTLPEAFLKMRGYTGRLYGFLHPETECHLLWGWEGNEPPAELGAEIIGYMHGRDTPASMMYNDPPNSNDGVIEGTWGEDGPEFTISYRSQNWSIKTPLKVSTFSPKQDVFSRNVGLLEPGWMSAKGILFVGAGSVGSSLMLQAARSGVEKIGIVDHDLVEVQNICRHQCSIPDIGRRKADAMAERILRINPHADILRIYKKIQDVRLHEVVDWIDPKNTIVVAACDNRIGNAYACDLAFSLGIPFLSLGFTTRAWGAHLFYAIPENNDICYHCAFKTQIENDAGKERRNHVYIDMEDAANIQIEPGLDVDIEYGVAFASKLILDILNRDTNYKPRIMHTLSQFTIISGTADRTGAEPFWDKAFSKPIDYINVAISPESRREECEFCSKH